MYYQQKVKFFGNILTEKGLLPDKDKVETISRVKQPNSVKELQRFLGMITFLGKYIKGLTEKTAPLRVLIQKDKAWVWEKEQELAFQKLKNCLKQPPLLGYYDPNKAVLLSVDASQHSVGSVLIQDGRPIAIALKH